MCKFHTHACYPLCCLEFFKTVYLEVSNVQFGSFFQNPVTFNCGKQLDGADSSSSVKLELVELECEPVSN